MLVVFRPEIMSNHNTQHIPGLKQKKVFKIIVLGDSGVGKTCLTFRFCEGQFLDKSEATIGVDFRERNVRINNEEIKVKQYTLTIGHIDKLSILYINI